MKSKNNDETDYSTYTITINPDANIEEDSTGECKQAWQIQLSEPINSQIDLEKISKLVSHENYNVSLTTEVQPIIIANVSYFRDTNPYVHDPSAVAHFKLFEDIESLVGAIEAIQGKKFKDWWNPRNYIPKNCRSQIVEKLEYI